MTKSDQNPFPTMRRHARGMAVVRLSGRDFYLGAWASDTAQRRYDAVIAEWLSNGRAWPVAVKPPSVRLLALKYRRWARAYYRKGSRVTTSYFITKHVIGLLKFVGLLDVPINAFTARLLREFQLWLLREPHQKWARKTINDYVAVVVSMFSWGVHQGLVQPSTHEALKCVPGLRKGRRPDVGLPLPRDGQRVTPVPDDLFNATVAQASPMLRAMIHTQLLTGMRPGELVAMRRGDLHPSSIEGVWAYHVPSDANKTEHHEIDRVVFIGPRAWEHVKPWLPTGLHDFVFSAKRATDDHLAERRSKRVTPIKPYNDLSLRRRRRRERGVHARSDEGAYSTASYRRSITRLCDRVFPPPAELARRKGESDAAWIERLTPDQRVALDVWQKDHRWHPHQLRHGAATYIVEHENLDVAMLVLGHTSIDTTMRYVQTKQARAAKAAFKLG